MATITLLSLAAQIEGQEGVQSYGGQDTAEALSLLEGLDGPLRDLRISFSGFNDYGEARLLARRSDTELEAVEPGRTAQLYDDALAWLREMS